MPAIGEGRSRERAYPGGGARAPPLRRRHAPRPEACGRHERGDPTTVPTSHPRNGTWGCTKPMAPLARTGAASVPAQAAKPQPSSRARAVALEVTKAPSIREDALAGDGPAAEPDEGGRTPAQHLLQPGQAVRPAGVDHDP